MRYDGIEGLPDKAQTTIGIKVGNNEETQWDVGLISCVISACGEDQSIAEHTRIYEY